MFYEARVIEPETQLILGQLAKIVTPLDFFLVGGTALAIQQGHRLSVDLDFFRIEAFDSNELAEMVLSDIPANQVISSSENSLHLVIRGVKVDVLRYSYPLLESLIEADGYRMASIVDIAAMKLSAITNRGSKKDFFDLAQLLHSFELRELLDFYCQKFPQYDPLFVIRSLSYFDDAELEPDPLMLTRLSWEEVKRKILGEVKRLARHG